MDTRLLKRVPIFSTFPDEQLDRITELCVQRSCPRDHVIVIAEEVGDSLFVIGRGSVKVSYVSENGREVILAILKKGDFFGELSLLDGETRSANVTALESTELLMLRRGDFTHLIEEYPEIAIGLLRELAQRIRKCDLQIASLTLHDAIGRVASAIVRVAEQTGRPRGGSVVIPKLPIQQDLASMAGTARETISRVMAEFEENGYIEKEGHRLVILDFEKFKKTYTKVK